MTFTLSENECIITIYCTNIDTVNNMKYIITIIQIHYIPELYMKRT